MYGKRHTCVKKATQLYVCKCLPFSTHVWEKPLTCLFPPELSVHHQTAFLHRAILQPKGYHLLQRLQDLLTAAQTDQSGSLPSYPARHLVLLPHVKQNDQVPQNPALSPNPDHSEGAQHHLGTLPRGLARRRDRLCLYGAALFKPWTLGSVSDLVDANTVWLLCPQHCHPSSLSEVCKIQ